MSGNPPIRGRGTSSNPANRFERIEYVPDPDDDLEVERPRTEFFADTSKSILVRNESPDVRFDVGVNPYRGCEHGCAYCFARPHHEYLGLSAGLDFETKIFVKRNAPDLLRKELSSPGWEPTAIGFSGVTDPYQPIERKLGLSRKCLEVLADFRNPVIVITKNQLVARDTDYLAELARHRAALVLVSVTTLDASLARSMEPRTSSPSRRIEAIAALSDAGIPVGVLVAPVIPGLTDHEIPAILDACAGAGASFAGYVTLRLPHGVKELFSSWLKDHQPQRSEKVLNRVRAMRGGKLYDSTFGKRGRGSGAFADQIASMWRLAVRRAGLATREPELSVAAFRRRPEQGSLFD